MKPVRVVAGTTEERGGSFVFSVHNTPRGTMHLRGGGLEWMDSAISRAGPPCRDLSGTPDLALLVRSVLEEAAAQPGPIDAEAVHMCPWSEPTPQCIHPSDNM